MLAEIVDSIIDSKSDVKDLESLPSLQGIYAFFLSDNSHLGSFGKSGQLIYLGIAEKCLNSRDTGTHLKSGMTGWSTFRRSLGAILKNQLNLIAEKRDINPKKLRADKYKFNSEGEQRLSNWMRENLVIGYWATTNPLTIERLRIEEKKAILELKPTLDLDRRTKKYNPLAKDLDDLRGICRNEVR